MSFYRVTGKYAGRKSYESENELFNANEKVFAKDEFSALDRALNLLIRKYEHKFGHWLNDPTVIQID